MVSVCLPSDDLLQHLPSYWGFSYVGCGVSLHSCSSKVQPLLLTLEEGYLLTAALPDLQCGIAPLGPPAPAQPGLLDMGLVLPAAAPGLGHGGLGAWCSSSRLLPLASGLGVWGSSSRLLPLSSGLGCGVTPLVAAPGLGCLCPLKIVKSIFGGQILFQ